MIRLLFACLLLTSSLLPALAQRPPARLPNIDWPVYVEQGTCTINGNQLRYQLEMMPDGSFRARGRGVKAPIAMGMGDWSIFLEPDGIRPELMGNLLKRMTAINNQIAALRGADAAKAKAELSGSSEMLACHLLLKAARAQRNQSLVTLARQVMANNNKVYNAQIEPLRQTGKRWLEGYYAGQRMQPMVRGPEECPAILYAVDAGEGGRAALILHRGGTIELLRRIGASIQRTVFRNEGQLRAQLPAIQRAWSARTLVPAPE